MPKPESAAAAHTAQIHRNHARNLQRQGQAEEALVAFRQAAALDPHGGEAEDDLAFGALLYGAAEPNQAIAAWRRGVEKNPRLLAAYLNLGKVLAEMGDSDAACAAYRQGLALKADALPALRGLGKILAELGQLKEAAEIFHRILAKEPHDPQALAAIAGILERDGKTEEAYAVLSPAVKRGVQDYYVTRVFATLCTRRIPASMRRYP